MATLDIERTYASEQTPTQKDIDNIVDSVEAFLNITGISDDNINNASITASTKFVDASITKAKMATDAATTAKIQDDAVTTNRLADGAVTTAKILDDNVTIAKVADDAASTDQFVDGSVDPVHVDPNQEKSTWSANLVGGPGDHLVVGQTTITTNGGPVLICLVPRQSTSGNSSFKTTNTNPWAPSPSVEIYRDSTRIGYITDLNGHNISSVTITRINSAQAGHVRHLDDPGAGTYTYSIQFFNSGYNGTFIGDYWEVTAWEL